MPQTTPKYITLDDAIRIVTKWSGVSELQIEGLTKLPAADVAPVIHAHWINLGKYSDGYNWRCSSCKRESVMAINFCPNCGARMDKDDDKDG